LGGRRSFRFGFPLPVKPPHSIARARVSVSMFEKSQAEKRGGGAAAQERRGDPRYAFSASAEAVHIQADTQLSGRVSDLGRGGC